MTRGGLRSRTFIVLDQGVSSLTNLAALPSHGFTLSCFPVKIERASAGWIRAVAMVDG